MTWSDYVKVKKIGEGAFGSAWLVKNKKDNKDYVVKKINVAKMPTKEREEAKKEVSVLAQMNHPNIVSYIDSFEEDGNLCIVMDYCDGGDLYTKIQSMRGNPINEDQILDWFVQIALALKHVHDRKILHRDLKSQNIFLTKSGVIKLGDFGVAKVLNNTSEFARTAIGTPYYMSPEICNHMSYNNKSDVWSLGCILFEMTNMKHPFEANNLKMLICKIIRGTYDQVNPRYSYEMRNLVASMLKKNPRERPSVNGILRKPFIMRRCARFLTNEEMQDEFSHTVLHGENFRRKLHVQNNAAAKPSAKPLNVPVVNVLANPHPRPIYDPSKIYGQPLYKRPSSAVQKSQEKKSIDIKRRPPSVERPIIKGSYLEQRQEKKEHEEALLRKKQKELIEKQKIERIKRERELGWQNILPSNDKEQDDNKEKHPFVNYNRGADHYKMYEQQLNEHAKRRQELEEAHDRLADQLKNRVPLVDQKEKIEPKKRANVNKVKKSSEEFKKIKEEYEKNRANGKRIFNNPITPRPQIVKKSNEQQLKEKLDKIRGNKSYLNRKPACEIKSKQNQIISNEKPRFGAPLKRPSPLR
ncbi:serine threonine- kinase Nek1-like isoform X1, partial [Brachionus plicatilis]